MPSPANRRSRSERILARLGLASLAVGTVVLALAIDIATAPRSEIERGASAAETWSLKLVTHDGRILGGFPQALPLTLSPLLHYENLPTGDAPGDYRINSLGCRGPEPKHPPRTASAPPSGGPADAASQASAAPVVCVVGGSAAFGMFVPEELTFCRLLADRFPDLEVLNAGVMGYLSGQETALVALRLLDLRPRLIVAVNGWNDCYDAAMWRRATGREHAVPGVNSSFQIMEQRLADHRRVQLEPGAAAVVWWNACLRRSRALGWLRREAPAPAAIAYPRELLDRAVDAYVENLLRMQRLARGGDARLVVALQPEARQLAGPSPDHPLAEQLDGADYTHFRQRATERLTAAGIETIDVSHVWAARQLASQTVLLDLVHLSPAGHSQMANTLEPYLEDVRREAKTR